MNEEKEKPLSTIAKWMLKALNDTQAVEILSNWVDARISRALILTGLVKNESGNNNGKATDDKTDVENVGSPGNQG